MRAFDFKTFSQPVIATLADLGVKAEFTGRNDLESMVKSSVEMLKHTIKGV